MGALDEFSKLFDSQPSYQRTFITPTPKVIMTAEQLEGIANKLREIEEMVGEAGAEDELSRELYYIIGVLDGHAQMLKEKAKPVMREPTRSEFIN